MATTATFARYPAPAAPAFSTSFQGGLTVGALVTAGVDATPEPIDYAAFQRFNGTTVETVDISAAVPRVMLVSNTGSATVNVYPDGLTAAAGGFIPLPAGASLTIAVDTAAFPLAFGSTAGGEVVSVLALMSGTVVTA